MLKTINDYFYFSQKERRGIFVLLSLIILLIAINVFIIPQMGGEKPINKDAFMAWVDSLMQNPVDTMQTKAIEYFNFDPNLIVKEDWLNLGLSESQTKTILNYRKAGGTFFKKTDLKKIYSINEGQYLKLEPYIIFTTSTNTKKTYAKSIVKIELNASDSIDLIKIRGIGSVFASRILKYRKLLGGYSQASQLTEVYGIDSSKFQKLKQHFSACDSNKIIRININIASFRELLKHPYISYEFVKRIVNERRKKDFSSFKEFSKRTNTSDSLLRKLKPYLIISTK